MQISIAGLAFDWNCFPTWFRGKRGQPSWIKKKDNESRYLWKRSRQVYFFSWNPAFSYGSWAWKELFEKRIGSIIKLTKQTLSSQIAIKKCESVVGNFYTEKCTDCRWKHVIINVFLETLPRELITWSLKV